jgi:methionine sulfoxide reductase catalytic subunit
MLIKKSVDFRDSEITPKKVYLERRAFLASLPAAFLAGRELLSPTGRAQAAVKLEGVGKSPLSIAEPPNSYNDITHYNNFYEFTTTKTAVADQSKNYKTSPWTVSVEGLVKQPRKFSMDEILKLAPLEERVTRHRCVEGWSMIAPWVGYSLNELLKQVQPTEKARYVAFESYFSRSQMPHADASGLVYPYVEGLRMDEAMHPLAMLVVGLYGETLPPQDGAPVRLVVPWKYGFKSIKSIVKIKLVDKQPPTTWNISAPDEYGFYSNVNPAVDHPRWSQATEHRLGELRRRPTVLFNGYGDQVAGLYSGMNLKKNY